MRQEVQASCDPAVRSVVRGDFVTRQEQACAVQSSANLMHSSVKYRLPAVIAASCLVALSGIAVFAAPRPPVFETVFPAGGQAGQAIEVTVTGSNLESLHGNIAGLRC